MVAHLVGDGFPPSETFEQPSFPRRETFEQPSFPRRETFAQPSFRRKETFAQPSFPRKETFAQPSFSRRETFACTTVIPAQGDLCMHNRHSRAGRPLHAQPSFPRRRESRFGGSPLGTLGISATLSPRNGSYAKVSVRVNDGGGGFGSSSWSRFGETLRAPSAVSRGS